MNHTLTNSSFNSKTTSNIIQSLLFVVLFFSLKTVHAHVHNEHCGHDDSNTNMKYLDVEEDYTFVLQNNLKYPQIRIDADYNSIEEGIQKAYIQYELIPAVLDYFQSALTIKRPLKSSIRIPSTQKETCGVATPEVLLTSGIEADLVLIVTTITDKNSSLAAQSSVCYRTQTGRPLITRIKFNTENLPLPKGDPLVHERNIYLAMHEMIHSLGFSKTSYKYFVDEDGNPRVNHLRNIQLNGQERTILDVDPLTNRLRRHLGCPSLPGVLLENDGNNGSRNSHFERRLFLYEVMTSGVLHGRRVSEFSLALLEGSGWYVPDYTYAEPFFFGQGQGCEFWSGPQVNDNSTSSEFCSQEAVRGCAPTGRGGGKCTSDFKADGYLYNKPALVYDCENPGAEAQARLKGHEVFGREAGSKCFSGTLSTQKKEDMTSFCFKFTCKGQGLDTLLEVNIGGKVVVCAEEGPINVKGFSGELMCPDPISYCNTVGKQYCPRNCMGRGDCVNNQCKCKPEYTGVDCSIKVGKSFFANTNSISA